MGSTSWIIWDIIAPCSTFALSTGRAMVATKSTTLTLRIDPDVKEALRTAAGQEHRSLTNMIEVLIRDYCSQHKIEIQGQSLGHSKPMES
jgi:hypothetical protein